MTEQERSAFAEDDDVEGHVNKFVHGADAEQAEDDDDDVEGHRAIY